GQSETFGRIDLVQFLQNPITLGPLRLPDDVEAAQPGGQRDSAQEQDRDCPSEQVGLLPLEAVAIIEAKKIGFHAWDAPVVLVASLGGPNRLKRGPAAAGPRRIWIYDAKAGAGQPLL